MLDGVEDYNAQAWTHPDHNNPGTYNYDRINNAPTGNDTRLHRSQHLTVPVNVVPLPLPFVAVEEVTVNPQHLLIQPPDRRCHLSLGRARSVDEGAIEAEHPLIVRVVEKHSRLTLLLSGAKGLR